MTENKNSVTIDYLNEYTIPESQKWGCYSFVSGRNVKNYKGPIGGLYVNIGNFSSQDEAQKHANRIQKDIPHFHIFVGENGKWLEYDPDPDSVKEFHYREPEQQKFMKSYLEEREKAKEFEAERKQELMQESVKSTVEKEKEAKANKNKRKQEKKKASKHKKLENKKSQNEEKETKQVEAKSVAKLEHKRDDNTKMSTSDEISKKEELIKKEGERLKKNEEIISQLSQQNDEESKKVTEALNKAKLAYKQLSSKQMTK